MPRYVHAAFVPIVALELLLSQFVALSFGHVLHYFVGSIYSDHAPRGPRPRIGEPAEGDEVTARELRRLVCFSLSCVQPFMDMLACLLTLFRA